MSFAGPKVVHRLARLHDPVGPFSFQTAKVSADPAWIEYMNGNMISVLTDKTEAFTKTVTDEVDSTIAVLKSVGQISEGYSR